jgi:hypothetical protein
MQFTVNSRNQKFPGPLPPANTSNQPSVLTFQLPLPEGRAGDAWDTSNKMMLFLPPSPLTSLHEFPFLLLFYYILSLPLELQCISLEAVILAVSGRHRQAASPVQRMLCRMLQSGMCTRLHGVVQIGTLRSHRGEKQ